MASEDRKEEREEPREPEVLEPTEIVSAVYKSLDKQIQALESIPKAVEDDCENLLKLALDETKDVFQKSKDIEEFTFALLRFDQNLGHAMHMVITLEENERGTVKEEQPKLQLPQVPLQNNGEKAMPNIYLGTAEQQRKGGLFDYLSVRKTSRMVEKLYEIQAERERPEITTPRVKTVKAYGEEIQSELIRLMDFYHRSKQRISFFSDTETVRNQRDEICSHLTKVVGIVRAFTTAIVEYRKERFGDRKVGVAAGVMYLEAAKYAQKAPYISPFSPPSQRLGRKPDE